MSDVRHTIADQTAAAAAAHQPDQDGNCCGQPYPCDGAYLLGEAKQRLDHRLAAGDRLKE